MEKNVLKKLNNNFWCIKLLSIFVVIVFLFGCGKKNNPVQTEVKEQYKIVFLSDRDGIKDSYGYLVSKIYTMNENGSKQKRLIDDNNKESYPVFTPEGDGIFYIKTDRIVNNIYYTTINGTNSINLTNIETETHDTFKLFGSIDSKIVFSPTTKVICASGMIGIPASCMFTSGIYTINSDGTNKTKLTENSNLYLYYFPVFANNENKIVFTEEDYSAYRDINYEICTINIDGTNKINLTNNKATDLLLSVNPITNVILFRSDRDGDYELYSMDIDGANLKQLTNNNNNEYDALFSSDGNKIIFTTDNNIFIINSDSSNQKQLTNDNSNNFSPSFSPDGNKIVFVSDRDGDNEIYTMDLDGNNLQKLTDNTTDDTQPSFSKVKYTQ